jgi:hypothetical protein
MKKKTFFQRISVCSLLLIALFFACSFLQTGCNNSGGQTKEPVSQTAGAKNSNNWVSMDITFMPNTNEEWRDKSISAIEKMLINSVAPFTKKYANFYPSISVTKMPFLDSLKYRLSVLNTYYDKTALGEPKLLKSSGPTPPCPPCPGLCPACDSTNSFVSSTYKIAKMVFEEPK